MVTRWCKAHTRMPVIVKLTPNITDIRKPAQAAHAGGADAVSLINTINSITGVDLDTFAPEPTIDGKGAHGGYCGPAVKPIALCMVARDRARPGDGGPADQRHRRDHHLARRGRVHRARCRERAGLHGGDDLRLPHRAGDDRGARALDGRQGPRATSTRSAAGRSANVVDWQHLNLNYVTKARIDQDLCIKCGRCFAACEDTSHQAIAMKPGRVFEVIDAECVACNLCINVCPVEDCITMEALAPGAVDARTGRVVTGDYANWTTHPNNPMAKAAE